MSLMLLKPTRKLTHGGGKRLEDDSDDYKIVLDWIAAGAKGPRDDDARLQRLEVTPAAATLKPKDTLNVTVKAHYSDGRAEDVTRSTSRNTSPRSSETRPRRSRWRPWRRPSRYFIRRWTTRARAS